MKEAILACLLAPPIWSELGFESDGSSAPRGGDWEPDYQQQESDPRYWDRADDVELEDHT